MPHYHSFTNTSGQIANIQTKVQGGDFSSLTFNNQTYYFPPGCGVEEIQSKPIQKLFLFKLYLKLSKSSEPQLYEFCAPPLPLEENNNLCIVKRGCHGCGGCHYINRTDRDIFVIEQDNSYLIPISYYNDRTNRPEDGIMYKFEDKTILDEWNRRIKLYLDESNNDFNGIQVAIEVTPNRQQILPYHYSPLVFPSFLNIDPCRDKKDKTEG